MCVYILIRHQDTSTAIGLFEVNGVAFESPSVPVLLQILSGAQKASDLLPTGSIYGLDANKSVELTIPAGAPGGPVSYTESQFQYIMKLMLVTSINSTLSICTGTPFMWSAAPIVLPTTSTTLSSEMWCLLVMVVMIKSLSGSSPTILDRGSSIVTSIGT